MKLGFVTDSTSDLPGAIVQQHELEVIPCILVMDGKEYVDGIEITRDEFYKRLATMPTSIPITDGRGLHRRVRLPLRVPDFRVVAIIFSRSMPPEHSPPSLTLPARRHRTSAERLQS